MRLVPGLDRQKTYLETNKPDHIRRIQRLIQQPSVSTEDLGVRECAELLVEYHRELGCQETELVETDGLPGLWAYYDAGAPKTIIVYGNFDTVPVLPHQQWEYSAFGGVITSSGPYGKVLVGRGALNNKGPCVAWLNESNHIRVVKSELMIPDLYESIKTAIEFIRRRTTSFVPLGLKDSRYAWSQSG